MADFPKRDLNNYFGQSGKPAGAGGTPNRPMIFPNPQQRPVTEPIGDAPVQQDLEAGVETVKASQSSISLDDLLNALLDQGSSDLHLKAGRTPMMRRKGHIVPVPNFQPISSSAIREMLYDVMTDEQMRDFEQNRELDMAYEIAGRSRFRVNVHQQRRNTGAVIRVIPNEIKSLEQLGMPAQLAEFAQLPRGLVLVTGPTGSGKSTTLAAILDVANETRSDNIITIEDPIEFVHQDKKCIVIQREIGVDTKTFSEALKRALRQDPDIILVGEMRDPETIGIAITAAETGHLVFGTLHTQSSAATMSRIIDAFPEGAKETVKAQLASTIQGIVCQTLVPTLDGKGRVAAVEILKGENNIRALIRKGQLEQIQTALVTGKGKGMQTLNMHLAELVKADKISVDDALLRASSQDELKQDLGGEAEVQRIKRRQDNLGGTATYGLPGR